MTKENYGFNSPVTRFELLYAIAAFAVFCLVLFIFNQFEEGSPLKELGSEGGALIVLFIIGMIFNYIRLLHLTLIERKKSNILHNQSLFGKVVPSYIIKMTAFRYHNAPELSP